MAAAKKPAAAKPAGAAKKVAPAVLSSDDEDIRSLLESMQEAVGEENAMLLGAESVALKIRGVISTRVPQVDDAIGRGGIPIGRITILHGGEGSGKTTLCLQSVAEVQSDGGWAVYYDHEHKLDPDYAEALGVQRNRLIISQPDTLEQFFDSAHKFVDAVIARRLKTGVRKRAMIIQDSINAAISKAVLEGEAGDIKVAPEARVWSKQLPKLNKRISREDIALVLISQVRKKIGVMFGDGDEIGGGQAPRFYASLIMKVVRIGGETEDGVKTANKTQVTCVKNQVAAPFRKAQFLIRYGKGGDFSRSLVLSATQHGIIMKAGSTYFYNDEKLGIGEGAAAKFLKKNPKVRDEINTKFREQRGWA